MLNVVNILQEQSFRHLHSLISGEMTFYGCFKFPRFIFNAFLNLHGDLGVTVVVLRKFLGQVKINF